MFSHVLTAWGDESGSDRVRNPAQTLINGSEADPVGRQGPRFAFYNQRFARIRSAKERGV